MMNDTNNAKPSDKPIIKTKPARIKVEPFVSKSSVILRNNKTANELVNTSNDKVRNSLNRKSLSLEDVVIKKPTVARKPTILHGHLNKFLNRSETKTMHSNVWPNFSKTIQYSESTLNSPVSSNINTFDNYDILSINDLNGEELNVDESLEAPTSPMVTNDNYNKAFLVAKEFLTTEQNYVNKLRLIDQVFHTELKDMNKEKKFIANDSLDKIFSDTKSIYTFHETCFLPKLTQCIDKWNDGPKLSEVMTFCAPFLKLYTDYVKNFQQTNDLLRMSIQKSNIFSSALADIEKREVCGNLSLQHYLLEPIQRVPKYELLLKEYVRKLPLDCLEKSRAEEALQLVNKSAQHINNQIHKLEEGNQLLEVSSSIVGMTDLISPHRLFLKQGKVKKVSARDASLVERYLFLFNDILLVCRCLPLKIGFSQQYLLKSKLDIPGMMILNGECESLDNCFLVKSKQKCVEFHISSSQEMVDWLQALYSAIRMFTSKEAMKTSLGPNELSKEEIGLRAPAWIRDQDTSMCMICSQTFTLVHRRHHCRACGKVVCNGCSMHRIRLQYDDTNHVRVCDTCHSFLGLKSIRYKSFSNSNKAKGSNLYKMPANSENFVLSCWAKMSNEGKYWVNRWIALHTSCVLFIYKAKQDISAEKTIALPGYRVTETSQSVLSNAVTATKNDAESDDENIIISISHVNINKILHVLISDPRIRNKWFESLIFATSANLSAYIKPMKLKVEDVPITEEHINNIKAKINNSQTCEEKVIAEGIIDHQAISDELCKINEQPIFEEEVISSESIINEQPIIGEIVDGIEYLNNDLPIMTVNGDEAKMN